MTSADLICHLLWNARTYLREDQNEKSLCFLKDNIQLAVRIFEKLKRPVKSDTGNPAYVSKINFDKIYWIEKFSASA